MRKFLLPLSALVAALAVTPQSANSAFGQEGLTNVESKTQLSPGGSFPEALFMEPLENKTGGGLLAAHRSHASHGSHSSHGAHSSHSSGW